MNLPEIKKWRNLLIKVNPQEFDMAFYTRDNNQRCCSVGHVLESLNLRGKVTPYDFAINSLELTHREFLFLFGSAWVMYDNSLQGAINRMNYVIKNGQVPVYISSTQEAIMAYLKENEPEMFMNNPNNPIEPS